MHEWMVGGSKRSHYMPSVIFTRPLLTVRYTVYFGNTFESDSRSCAENGDGYAMLMMEHALVFFS